MNNGNAARQLDDMPQAENPSAKQWQQHEGDIAQRDRAIDQGDQVKAAGDAQKQVTIVNIGERAVNQRNRWIASDGTVHSSHEKALDYERGLRN